MAADTPPTPRKPTAKGIAQQLKNPRVAVLVGVLALALALYFRSRQRATSNLPVADGSSTPVNDPTTDYNYPGATQGAAPSSGDFGGYSTPAANQPDWLMTPPAWLTETPSWITSLPSSIAAVTEPAATNASNPVSRPILDPVTLNPGQSLYDPNSQSLVTAPRPTGGGPPNPPNHRTPPKAQPPKRIAGGTVIAPPRVNRAPGSPRAGQTYQTVRNPKGKPKGVYHVYGSGKNAKFVRMS